MKTVIDNQKKSFYTFWGFAFLLFVSLIQSPLFAQSHKLEEFVLLSNGQGCSNVGNNEAVEIGNNASILGGFVGSKFNIESGTNLQAGSSFYTERAIEFKNNSTITGNIYAAWSSSNSFAVEAGNSFNLTGDVFSQGKIKIKTGSVAGTVTKPASYSYSGPTPSGGVVNGSPALPGLPQLPAPKVFAAASTGKIQSTVTITPGQYGDIKLNGNDVLTFSGPGVYVFRSIENSGNTNYFKYDFLGSTDGLIEIHVHGNVNLDKTRSIFIGGDASQVFLETHGTGSGNSGNAFVLKKTTTGLANSTLWSATVFAPNGSIEVEAATGANKFSGALWAGKEIEIKNGSEIKHVPLKAVDCNCIIPIVDLGGSGKTNDLIGIELTGLNQNANLFTSALPDVFIIRDGYVFIEVVTIQGQTSAALALLVANGLIDQINNGPNSLIISGKFPIANLHILNTLNQYVRYVRPLYPPLLKAGIAETKGDIAQQTDEARGGYGLNGEVIKLECSLIVIIRKLEVRQRKMF